MCQPKVERKISLTWPGSSAKTTASNFFDHFSDREPAETAALPGAVGVLVGYFGEGFSLFELGLGGADGFQGCASSAPSFTFLTMCEAWSMGGVLNSSRFFL